MSKQVPFVLHIKVTPSRGFGKRMEYIRDLQKISILVYEALTGVSGVQVALPGGGQQNSMGDIQRHGGFGGFAKGTAIKPQIGDTPAQLMIAGFYTSSGSNAQPYADHQLISGGEIYTGPGSQNHVSGPTTTINNEVKALKAALEAAISAELPVGVTYSIFRLEYSGIIFGDRGFHFPI